MGSIAAALGCRGLPALQWVGTFLPPLPFTICSQCPSPTWHIPCSACLKELFITLQDKINLWLRVSHALSLELASVATSPDSCASGRQQWFPLPLPSTYLKGKVLRASSASRDRNKSLKNPSAAELNQTVPQAAPE